MGFQSKNMLKGGVQFKKKQKKTFADNFTHRHVIQDVHVFLSSVEKKLRFLMKTFQDVSPYNGLHWKPNCSRSKRQFQCSFKGL